MLVKLKNHGDGLRILYDIHGQSRQIRPGYELEVDIDPKLVARYQRAQVAGDTLDVELIDDDDQAEVDGAGADAGRNAPHTLREGQGLEPGQPGNVAQAETLRDATGHSGMPQRSHGEEDNKPDKNAGPEIPDGQTKSAEDRTTAKPAKQGDRISANAKQKAKPKASVPPVERTTAATLLRDRGSMNPEKLLAAANSILPKGALPRNPRPSQIISALQRQVEVDGKASRKQRAGGATAKDTKIGA